MRPTADDASINVGPDKEHGTRAVLDMPANTVLPESA